MKTIVIWLLVFPIGGFTQTIKKAELKALYKKTIQSIKNNDSISFFRLWEHPVLIYDICGPNPDYTYHKIDIFENFKTVRTNWKPFIRKLKLFDITIHEMEKQDIKDSGQSISFSISYNNEKDTLYEINSYVKYINKRRLVYCKDFLLPGKLKEKVR